MAMTFASLLDLCESRGINVHSDSRRVGAGDIFVAIPGEEVDGARYIPQALANGARYVVCAENAAFAGSQSQDCQIIRHAEPREALWRLAAARWHTKSLPLKIIGVTGTNGKTTNAALLEHIFTSMGYRTGVLGTISYHWPGHNEAAPLTTPDPLSLHSMLNNMAEAGVRIVIMEVSSHALAQGRVDGISFAGAIFTNLTQDHLDFHKNMESYFQAKARLFLNLPNPDKAVAINADDAYGRRLLQNLPEAVSFGIDSGQRTGRHLGCKIIESGRNGFVLEMNFGDRAWRIQSPLVGHFNVMNLLSAQALALGLGIEPEILASLASFRGVKGRLERVGDNPEMNVFVDYAHTPDALVNALEALRGAGFQRIITVFGCGGNRDRLKRPLMGKAVADFSDVAILTSDNPRFEDPADIINDVIPGLASAAETHIEPDRRKATALGLKLLGKKDALLIAGKGHEDYQIVNGVRHHYSDQEVVRELARCE